MPLIIDGVGEGINEGIDVVVEGLKEDSANVTE
jgi:hypothetical protein